ncbi:hypothetical protein RCC89_11595 [Cytophagaceae bacterium ABcell3]|nr:hypothetical protein RCC89_11595 [Cytophagaceae bacterium ABcell3]
MARPPKIKGPRPVVRKVVKKTVKKNPEASDSVAKKPDPAPQSTPVSKPEVKKEPQVAKPAEQPVQESKATEPKAPAPATPPAAKSEPIAKAEPTPAAAKTETKAEVKAEPKAPTKKEELKSKAKKERPAKPEKEKTKRSGTGAIIVLSLLVLGLGGVIGFLLFEKQETETVLAQEEQKSASYKSDVKNKLDEISRLQDSIKMVIREKEALGMELAEERQKLAQLDELKAEIQNKNISIRSLNNKLANYQKNYNVAQANMSSLEEENQKLKALKDTLEARMAAQNDSIKALAEVKTELSEKVAVASALKAENIDVAVFNTAGKEVKPGSIKSQYIKRVKASLTLAENKVAQPGKKDIYMRLIEPGGITLFTGQKSFEVDGRELVYTDKQTIDFDNTNQTITFYYDKGSKYKPGTYRIEFYSEGQKVGDGKMVLKK